MMDLVDKDFKQLGECEAETWRLINSRWDIAEGINMNTEQSNRLKMKQKKHTEHQ